MCDPVCVGIVDSGCRPDQMARVRDAWRFGLDHWGKADPDSLGHGAQLLDVIARQATAVEFLVAQVFASRLTTTADQVAAAIDWLVEQGADLINLSLGLRDDRPVLRAACERAVASGAILCASTPAQGNAVFPAAYPGVLRMTGDARCQPHQFSSLGTRNADYGGCVRVGGNDVVGASVGCAHMSGHIARYLSAGGDRDHLRGWLDTNAAFVGREHRGIPMPERVSQ